MVGRVVSQMQLACGLDVVRVVEEHLQRKIPFDRAIFLLMILRGSSCLRAFCNGLASTAPTAIDGISINAVAMSLNRPFETVRRHVHALISDGLCQRVDHGVSVRSEILALPAFVTVLRLLHDHMVSVIEDLAHMGFPLPPNHVDRFYDPNATIAAAIDLILAPFDYIRDSHASWLELVVVHSVATASANKITRDPELSRRYGEAYTAPPQDLREPIAITALARTLRMSYSTVRREVESAVAAGKLVRAGHGVLASDAYLISDVIVQAGERATAHCAHVLRRLGPGGFRFDNPTHCYLDGKPAFLTFD
ncbi:MAG: DNA-binding Lrp family transcriptional regulator [Sphingomonas echinoides]|jgi:DNA-binding Lrp family transcriptional regulator